MEAAVSYLLMQQKCISSKQKIQNQNHIRCFKEMFRSVLQSITLMKKKLKENVKIFLLIIILLILTIF